jgi:hypothetical protein
MQRSGCRHPRCDASPNQLVSAFGVGIAWHLAMCGPASRKHVPPATVRRPRGRLRPTPNMHTRRQSRGMNVPPLCTVMQGDAAQPLSVGGGGEDDEWRRGHVHGEALVTPPSWGPLAPRSPPSADSLSSDGASADGRFPVHAQLRLPDVGPKISAPAACCGRCWAQQPQFGRLPLRGSHARAATRRPKLLPTFAGDAPPAARVLIRPSLAALFIRAVIPVRQKERRGPVWGEAGRIARLRVASSLLAAERASRPALSPKGRGRHAAMPGPRITLPCCGSMQPSRCSAQRAPCRAASAAVQPERSQKKQGAAQGPLIRLGVLTPNSPSCSAPRCALPCCAMRMDR